MINSDKEIHSKNHKSQGGIHNDEQENSGRAL